jgi:TolA-binding protein
MGGKVRRSKIIAISLLLIAFFFTGGCGKTDKALRFELEKMLTQADRLQDRLTAKGAGISDENLKQLIDSYSAIATKAGSPTNNMQVSGASDDKKQVWAIASLADTRIGTLYYNKRLYDKAYDFFKIVYDSPATTAIQRNAVLSYMANSMDKSGDYGNAAELYDSLATGYVSLIDPKHPNMDALEAPIKAADMWGKSGDELKFNASMDKARSYYQSLTDKYKGTLTEPTAIGKIAATYLQQQRYPEAIEVLRGVKDDTTGQTGPVVMLMIGDIYMKNLKDYPSAEKTYRQFINTYPNNIEIGAAELGLGLSLFEQKKYIEARKAVEGIEKLPKAKPQVVVQALFLVALCFDHEDKWELAKGQLEYIQSSFAGTNESFDAGLNIIDHYRKRGLSDIQNNSFDNFVDYVNKYIKQNNSDAVAVARALGYLVKAYTENNDLSKAAEQLSLVHDQYPQLPEGKLAPLRLSDMYENSLFDTTKAISWLKIFVKENPDAVDLDKIKSHIQQLESLTVKPN